MTTLIATDLAGRRAAALANPTAVPSSNQRDQEFGAQLRAKLIDRDGKKFYQFDGYASIVNVTYQMYDFWGPFDEKIDGAAFDKTLAADPDVAFLLNHRGTTMARTKVSKTLELSADETGLATTAFCNPERQDVKDMALAISDGDIDQMSFAFRIVRGQWSPDYTEYTILEVDLDRGDVSAVNYGANPYTSISARAKQAFDAIDHLEGPALQAALARAQARVDETEPGRPPAERSVEAERPSAGTLRARLELEEERR
ncbi:MAG: HK97 family phage prohead protease [Rhodoglobus sp.]